jgi:hypothetical protein
MTDLHHGGNAEDIRAWLSNKRFCDSFIGGERDSALGLTGEDGAPSYEEGLKLRACRYIARCSEGMGMLCYVIYIVCGTCEE